MADGAVLENPERKKARGIISFKGLIEAIDKALDGIDTKKAERRYDKIRSELISAGTQYTEEEYNRYAELAEKSRNLKPYERRQLLEDVMKGKRKEATKNRRRAIASAIYAGAETTVTAVTGEGILAGLLSTVGIVAPPATTIVACALAGGTLLVSLIRLKKGKKFLKAEEVLSNEDFMKEFNNLVDDVKKLCEELDKTKSQDIESLKTKTDKNNPNAKRVSAKEFKKQFAVRIVRIMDKLQLQNLNKEAVIQAYGIEAALKEAEDEQRKIDEEEARIVEEKAAYEASLLDEEAEKARKKQEEDKLNAQREQE